GSDRSRRPGSDHHAVAAGTLPLTPGGFVRREGDRGAAQRIRRPRGAQGMTSTAPRRVSARPSQVLRSLGPDARTAEPCTIVILGANGDLAKRKLLPAIYQLAKDKLLPPNFDVLGTAREPLNDESFRAMMREALQGSDEIEFDEALWKTLAPRMHYVPGDVKNARSFDELCARLEQIESGKKEEDRNRLFYLAVPPSIFATIVTALSESGLAPRVEQAVAILLL